jgi:L-aspartate oxidase
MPSGLKGSQNLIFIYEEKSMPINTDYLVIGSGIAGLRFALDAAKTGTVAIVTKKEKTEGSTNYAQGGIASVLDPDDSFDLHIKDTLTSGDGICHEDIVKLVVQEGPERIHELVSFGVRFSQQGDGGKDIRSRPGRGSLQAADRSHQGFNRPGG